ncbi:MAG: alpha-amylase family glycosyl hydrolase, partial [Myxococcota bacterium]
WDSRRRQYYLHHFLASQPDLNFHHPEVREAQLDNVRHWLDLGVDGLRLDVVNFYFHRADLRSNPPAVDDPERTPTTSPDNPFSFQQHLYDITQPENLAFIEALRRLTNDYPGVFLLGEISDDHSIDVMASYTQGQDRLHTAYTFELLGPNSAADYLRGVLARIDAGLGEGWPCWALSNHDVVRCASRWGRGAEPEAFTPVAMALLLSLRGTVCLYQGEELGLEQAEVPFDRIQDPYGVPFWPEYKGRDGARTPMVWESGPHGGFSTGEPWLPVDPRHAERAVSFQEEDESRCLHAIRALLAWRRRQPALRKGSLSLVKDSGEMLMWRRTSEDQDLVCAFNLTDRTLKASLPFEIRRRHQVTFADGGLLAEGQLTLGPFQTFFPTSARIGSSKSEQEEVRGHQGSRPPEADPDQDGRAARSLIGHRLERLQPTRSAVCRPPRADPLRVRKSGLRRTQRRGSESSHRPHGDHWRRALQLPQLQLHGSRSPSVLERARRGIRRAGI